ncbi:hydantoinase B/oxoprolinase family protein [Natrialbaceae archaeon A-CW2]
MDISGTEGSVDPITLEVLWSRVTRIAEEMGTHLHRTAFSEVVKHAQDFSTAVFSWDGRLIAQGVYTPGHLGCMPNAMNQILENHFGFDEWNPGDLVATNDPYIGAGHLTDIYTFEPIFLDNQLVGFCVATADYIDIGGSGPGSIAMYANDIYEEGLQIPPVKLREEGTLNDPLISTFIENSREPEKVHGDFRAQIGASRVGCNLYRDLVEEYGFETFKKYINEITSRSEDAMRQSIQEVPDGEYAFEEEMDGFEEPLPICASVVVDGDELTVDFEGTADQQDGYAINATKNFTFAYVLFTIKAAIDPDTPQTHGAVRPISMTAPEGSLVNVTPPAPVSARARIVNHLISTINGALHQAIPGEIPACGGQQNVIMAKYTNAAAEKQQILMDGFYGGAGATPNRDGVPSVASGANLQNNPIEVIEAEFPIRISQYELRPDTGGSGEFRGGNGTVRSLEFLQDAQVQLLTDRFKFGSYGLEGGHEGDCGGATLKTADNDRDLHSKERFTAATGDVLCIHTAAGGGYGDPSNRDPKAIERDLTDGLVTSREEI